MSRWLYDKWTEFFFFIIMLAGVIIALTARSALVSYVVILIAGIMAGRIIKGGETRLGFPIYMLITGFLVGYLIGSYQYSKVIILLLYMIGMVGSNYVFSREIIKDIRF